MKVLKTSTHVFSSLKSHSYVAPTIDYFQSFWDRNKYSLKTVSFKVGDVEYKDGKEWQKTYDENPKSQKHKRLYWYIVAGSSALGGLWGYLDSLRTKPDPAENIVSLCIGSATGCMAGIAHPILVPVAVRLASHRLVPRCATL